MVKMSGLIALALLTGSSGVHAGDLWLEDFVGTYLLRIEGVTDSAGNARNQNAAIHMIDPWPKRVRDRRIPVDGERMVGAVERYRDVRKLREAPPPLAPTLIPSSGLSGAATPGTTGLSSGLTTSR